MIFPLLLQRAQYEHLPAAVNARNTAFLIISIIGGKVIFAVLHAYNHVTRKLDTVISLLTGRRHAGMREATGPAEGRSAAKPPAPTSGANSRLLSRGAALSSTSSAAALGKRRCRRGFCAAPGVRHRPGGSAPQRPPRCAPPAPRSPLPRGSKLWGAFGAALQRGGGSGAAAAERRRLRGAARSPRSPAATRRAGCAPLPPLPPPSLPLPPDDFQFTCKQPGSAALPGTAVTASAPSPPRGGSWAGAACPAGKFGAAPGLCAVLSVETPRVPNPSPRRLPAAAGKDCPRAVNQLPGEGL